MLVMTNVAHYLQSVVTGYILDSHIPPTRRWDLDNKPSEEELTPVREEQRKFKELVQSIDISGNVTKDQGKISGLNVISAMDQYFEKGFPEKVAQCVEPIKVQLTKIGDFCRHSCFDKTNCEGCSPLDKIREKEEKEEKENQKK